MMKMYSFDVYREPKAARAFLSATQRLCVSAVKSCIAYQPELSVKPQVQIKLTPTGQQASGNWYA